MTELTAMSRSARIRTIRILRLLVLPEQPVLFHPSPRNPPTFLPPRWIVILSEHDLMFKCVFFFCFCWEFGR